MVYHLYLEEMGMHEPRSLVLAEIHAEPFLTFVPEPSASVINGGVADMGETVIQPASDGSG
jgi:hypothetical protein